MAMDMRIDLFAELTYGKVALQKIGVTDPNFRLYYAGWLGDGDVREVMRVTGAIFRESKSGPSKGQLSIKVPDTEQSVLVTSKEMDDYDAAMAAEHEQQSEANSKCFTAMSKDPIGAEQTVDAMQMLFAKSAALAPGDDLLKLNFKLPQKALDG